MRKRRHYYEPNSLSGCFALIFKYLTWSETNSSLSQTRNSHIEHLYKLQPLAAVSKTWRHAVLPIFYQAIVCGIKEVPDSKDHSAKSNLELIMSGGHQRYVQRLVIDMVGDVSPAVPVSLLSRLGFDDLEWYEIDRLDLNHWHGYIRRKPVYSADSLARLNAYLLHRLPKLISINYFSIDDEKYYPEFPLDSMLASRLSQLQEIRISTNIAPSMSYSAFLPNLTTLKLKSPLLIDSVNLPCIFAETLEHLHIGFSSAKTIWDRFYACTGTMVVDFKRLKTLSLEYIVPQDSKRMAMLAKKTKSLYRDCENVFPEEFSDSDNDNDKENEASKSSKGYEPAKYDKLSSDRVQCAFPQLEQLSICKYPYSITKILCYFDITTIPHIWVRDVANGWASLNPTYFAKSLSLRINISQDLETGYLAGKYQEWINRLFSLPSKLTSLQLEAPTAGLPMSLPDIISLTGLVSLSLGMQMDLGAIPNLLSRLPHLHQLITHIYPQSSWATRNQGVADFDDYETLAQLPPLSNSLENLVAYIGAESRAIRRHKRRRNESNEPGDVMGLVRFGKKIKLLPIEKELTWVLARIPTLSVFKSETWTSDAVSECIADILTNSQEDKQFSHLKTLSISQWEY
ncbi:hypothetical protein LPJ57_001246 [Coemansia sp. RSA 486]|nr:hypothetical protein LPJ57_001246 [Coemansia sp. RSA 486]KAJ2238079.1 hypothetical protein IWW45_000419 [Coemansia sp. RSA 485]KAJ2603561.1 hypothetical protein GGF39_000054 [Coemansia sp. RSA 1721]KAJ2639714.1 hypothetical protein GGF40_000680 [Coemansia sp. RSA 1286]